MSIRSQLLTVFVVLLALLISMVYVSRLTVENQRALAECETRRYESYKLADELRQSSDDLTRMARTYVATGDGVYEDYYNRILAIRNGEMPRPENYGLVYWDLLVPTGEAPRGDGRAVALQQLMRDVGFTKEEFGKLAESQGRSDGLVALEVRGMNAVKGRFDDGTGQFTVQREPDPALARDLMFGMAYHEAKAGIMEPINEFFQLVESRTNREVGDLRAAAARLVNIQLILATAAAVFAGLALLFLNRRVIRSLHQMIEHLKDIAEGEGNLTKRVEVTHADEVGTLARWFNRFIEQVHDIVKSVTGSTMEVTSAATEIAASARQQEQTVHAFQESTGQAATAVTEITATGRELTGIVQDVNQVAQSTSDRATASAGRLTELDELLSSMAKATAAISDRMDAIHARAGEITLATTAMTRVVDQTDLLSVNSAMEAEKAGEHGRGFRIVSREIRRLADQTAQATLEIEGIVTGIRESVSLGVSEAGRFGERMRTGIDSVRQIAHEMGAIISDVSGLGTRFADVREMMEAQSTGSEQIRDSIAQLKDVSRQIADSSAEFTQVTGQLQGTAERLTSQVSRFTVDSA